MKLEVDLLHAQPCLSMPRISADLLYNLPEMSTRKKKSGREHNCMYLVALEKLAGLLPEITFLASRGLNGGPLRLGNTAVSLHLVYKGGKFSSPVSDKNKKQKLKKKERNSAYCQVRFHQVLTSFVERTESSSRLRTASVRMTSWGKKRRLIVWKEEKQGMASAKYVQNIHC